MKLSLVIVALMLCILTALTEGCAVLKPPSDPCRCVSPYPWMLYRFRAKNEIEFGRFSVSRDTLTIDRLADWQKHRAQFTGTIDRDTKRRVGTPEETLYTLRGRLYYARQMFDCDFHMEMGSMDSTDRRRVVCEISVKNCYQQRVVKEYLERKGYRMGETIPGGLPCDVSGLAFFDGQHPLKKRSSRISQWEIHPVQRVNFLK